MENRVVNSEAPRLVTKPIWEPLRKKGTHIQVSASFPLDQLTGDVRLCRARFVG